MSCVLPKTKPCLSTKNSCSYFISYPFAFTDNYSLSTKVRLTGMCFCKVQRQQVIPPLQFSVCEHQGQGSSYTSTLRYTRIKQPILLLCVHIRFEYISATVNQLLLVITESYIHQLIKVVEK